MKRRKPTRETECTKLAAEGAVIAELSRRGYHVQFTFGNTREVDLTCYKGDDRFKVQVKGISTKGGPWIRDTEFDEPEDKNLYFVTVWVPLENDKPMRFFIMTHGEIKTAPRGWCGLNFKPIEPHENRWDKFEQRGKD